RMDRSEGRVRTIIWPEKVTKADLESLKVTLGSYRFSGQYQQRPSPADGGMLKKYWWKYWQPKGVNLGPVMIKLPDGKVEQRMPVTLPDRFDIVVQSWDMSFQGHQACRLRCRTSARGRGGRPLRA